MTVESQRGLNLMIGKQYIQSLSLLLDDNHCSVFVAHGNMDRAARPLDGHSYWKSKIVSIHKFKSKLWVIVQWYYTSTQLKELGME